MICLWSFLEEVVLVVEGVDEILKTPQLKTQSLQMKREGSYSVLVLKLPHCHCLFKFVALLFVQYPYPPNPPLSLEVESRHKTTLLLPW